MNSIIHNDLNQRRPNEQMIDAARHESAGLESEVGSMNKYHASVLAMAESMQEKLDKNAHKKGWPTKTGVRGWLRPHCDITFLQGKLAEECSELNEAIQIYNSAKYYQYPIDKGAVAKALVEIRLEAGDVANIAMMIADNLGAYDNEVSSI